MTTRRKDCMMRPLSCMISHRRHTAGCLNHLFDRLRNPATRLIGFVMPTIRYIAAIDKRKGALVAPLFTPKCPSLVSDVLLSHGLAPQYHRRSGLNFRVRNGTGCASPAMVADQRGAFCCQGGAAAVPWGPHSATCRRPCLQSDRTGPNKLSKEELGLLVPLG